MAAKIEIIDNALVITDTTNGEVIHDVPAKDHYFDNTQLKNGSIQIYDLYGLNEDLAKIFTEVLANTVDKDDVVFTEQSFRDFARLNLGKSSPQASGSITVNQSNVSTTLGGVIDSSKVYIIDGVVDLTGIEIEVPESGLSLIGYTFDISKLICGDSNYTMFKSPVGGSGNVLAVDMAIEATGVDSKAFDLVSATGFDAFEFTRVNFNDCTSLGSIDNYRQGLESGTGRFGGKPELELKGNWVGGYFIDTSIVRSLSDGAYSLFKAGLGFSMSSRFRSNQNIDLPASASFFDFSASNFTNPSTVQITEAIITRNGVFNPLDANITPNMNETELVSNWSNNNGMPNTFEGGSIGVASEADTIINAVGVFETLNAGSWSALDLQHFDNPSGNQLRQLGNTPREYKIVASFTLESSANDVLILRVRKWNASASSFVTVLDQFRQVNSLVGGRDVAFFNININTELDKDDYIEIQVANESSTSNVTAELDGYYIIEER